jgi:hypothetical protein
MRRLLLYAAAILIGGLVAVLAWAWPEARLAFTTLGIGVVGTLWWAARRFPGTKRPHLLGAALVTLLAGLSGAILFPSTQIGCDCPPPLQGVGGCTCPVDHHTYLRIGIALAGALGAWVLLVLANRKASRVPLL